MSDENISFLKEMQKNSREVILYGNNQLVANGSWMFLRQLGFGNVTILLGGYEYLLMKETSAGNLPEKPDYEVEQQIINFTELSYNAALIDEESPMNNNISKQIIPVKRKTKTITAGGC